MEEKKRIESDYREVFGRPMLSDFSGRCPNRFRDAAAMIASYLRKEQKGANGGYMLKSGIVIRYRGKLYTHLNLTAAAARHHLRQHRPTYTISCVWRSTQNRMTLWQIIRSKTYSKLRP